MTGKEDKGTFWYAENILYLDPGGGHIGVYVSENSSLKISNLNICVLYHNNNNHHHRICESLQSNHILSLAHS